MIYGECEERVTASSQVTTVRSFKKCDKDAMLSDLDRAPWHVMEVFSSVDEMWDYWKKLFLEVVGEHALLVKVRMKRESAEWIGEEIHKLIRTRNYYRTKHCKSQTKEDWNVFKNLQNEVRKKLRQAKEWHYTSVYQSLSKHSSVATSCTLYEVTSSTMV